MILVPSDRARLAVYPSSLYGKIAKLLLAVDLFIWTDVEPLKPKKHCVDRDP